MTSLPLSTEKIDELRAAIGKVERCELGASLEFDAIANIETVSALIAEVLASRENAEMDLWPDDPAPIADKAADHVFRDLAKALGLETWNPQDGSETWEGDVWATMMRILTDSGVIDPETGERASPPVVHAAEPVAWPRDWPSPLDVAQHLNSAAENLRSADKDERRVEAAFRIAHTLDGLARPLFTSPQGDGHSVDWRQRADALRSALQGAIEAIETLPNDAFGTNTMGDGSVPGGIMSWPIKDELLHNLVRVRDTEPCSSPLSGVTEEQVEAAARAIFEAWNDNVKALWTWEGAQEAAQDPVKFPKIAKAVPLCRIEARAALTAALAHPGSNAGGADER